MDNYENSTHWLSQAPLLHEGGGCWTCRCWFGEFTNEGLHIVCRDRHGSWSRHGMDHGCAFWQREPGADDEIVYSAEREARGWFKQELSMPLVYPVQMRPEQRDL